MKQFLFCTAGIALALLLAGCPTGSDDNDDIVQVAHDLTSETNGAKEENGVPTETVTIGGDLTMATEGTTITLTVAGLATDGTRQVTFSATDADGTTDAGITFTPDNLTADGNVTFTMPAKDVIITATFADVPPTTYSVLISPMGDNIGVAGVSPDFSKASEGTQVTLTVSNLTAGRQVTLSTSVAGVVFTPATLTTDATMATFTMPGEDITITATFADIPQPTYSVEVNTAPDSKTGETVTIDGDLTMAKEGATITLTVAGLNDSNPARQVTLSSSVAEVSFLDAGNTDLGTSPVITADGDVTFLMPSEDVTILATFADVPPITYSVEVDTVPGNEATETVTIDGDLTMAEVGATITLTVAGLTDTRQVTLSSSVAGVLFFDASSTELGTSPVITADGDVTFLMPGEDITITATFADIPQPTYSVTVGDGGTGTTGESVEVDLGEATEGTTITLTVAGLTATRKVTFSATDADGTTDAGITFSSGELTADGDVTFTMPAKDVIITATFADIPQPTYSVTVGDGGTGTTGESVEVDLGEATEGTTITLTVAGLTATRKVTFSATDADGTTDAGITFSSGELTADGDVTFTMPAKAVIITATFSDQ